MTCCRRGVGAPTAGMPRLARVKSLVTCTLLGLFGLPAEAQEAGGSVAEEGAEVPVIVLVAGAEGLPEYGEQFLQWAQRWREAAGRAGARFVQVGGTLGEHHDAQEGAKAGEAAENEAAGNRDDELEPGQPNDKQHLRTALAQLGSSGDGSLWLVMVGHGTFDGEQAKFNLRGPDVSAAELAEWLEGIERPLAVVNCSAASGPFINALSRPGRVIITATKSGYEQNFAWFGRFLSEAIVQQAVDLDKDEQMSLLEAFLKASQDTEDFYKQESRLATEHALVDDNGDQLGTPASWFRGVRVTRQAESGKVADGLRANQMHLVHSESEQALPVEVRERRDALELQLAELRRQKSSMDEDAYYEKIEPLLVELAELYEEPGSGG